MWEPASLCCFSRRTGSFILGYLELVVAVVGIIAGVSLKIVRAVGVLCSESIEVEDQCHRINIAVDTSIAILLICGAVQLTCASLMIHGVKKNNHCLMIPFLILNVIIVAVHIITAAVFVPFLCIKLNALFGILLAYGSGGIVFTWTYFLLTVRAYYYELKRGTPGDHHRLVVSSEGEVDAGNNP